MGCDIIRCQALLRKIKVTIIKHNFYCFLILKITKRSRGPYKIHDLPLEPGKIEARNFQGFGSKSFPL